MCVYADKYLTENIATFVLADQLLVMNIKFKNIHNQPHGNYQKSNFIKNIHNQLCNKIVQCLSHHN
jgi:hypothetical protein